jgi:hypothetical protein
VPSRESPSPPPRIEDLARLRDLVGQRVSLVGRLTTLQWARMSAFLPEHPSENLLEVGGGRLAVYTDRPIEAPGRVEVQGTVGELTGAAGSKAEGRVEHHLVADAWRALE